MLATMKIPEKRKAILIGRKGSIKRKIESLTKTKITVGEEITIEGEADGFLTAENIISAIGRGFEPKKAMKICDEDTVLIVMPLPRGAKILKTVRSRIIGTAGKARENLERLTHTDVSVYGRTVSVIGHYEDVVVAKEALEKLIAGSRHGNVYTYLEKTKKLKSWSNGKKDSS